MPRGCLKHIWRPSLGACPNKAARKYAKAALDLANELQHKRTASYRDAAVCTEATVAVVNLITLISGRTTRATTPQIQAEFSHQTVQCHRDEHLYQLNVAVTNTGKQAISNFKLEFGFPDFDTIPRKWVSVGSHRQPSGPSVEITPKDKTVSFSRDRFVVCISYRSQNILFPEEKLAIGDSIGLRYRINDDIYDNIQEMPPLRWTLYADNMVPKHGEISLAMLHNF